MLGSDPPHLRGGGVFLFFFFFFSSPPHPTGNEEQLQYHNLSSTFSNFGYLCECFIIVIVV
jgi:hypothetical protein